MNEQEPVEQPEGSARRQKTALWQPKPRPHPNSAAVQSGEQKGAGLPLSYLSFVFPT